MNSATIERLLLAAGRYWSSDWRLPRAQDYLDYYGGNFSTMLSLDGAASKWTAAGVWGNGTSCTTGEGFVYVKNGCTDAAVALTVQVLRRCESLGCRHVLCGHAWHDILRLSCSCAGVRPGGGPALAKQAYQLIIEQ